MLSPRPLHNVLETMQELNILTNSSKGRPPLCRMAKYLAVAAFTLFLCACATKAPPLFFPEEPAPPRIQLLTSFTNEGSLRNNELINFVVGNDYSDQLSKAYGLAFHDGKLYIADSGKANPGIAIVDFVEKKIKRIGEGITKPVTVTVDDDGTIYVCDLAEGATPAIVVMDNQFRYLRRMTLNIEGFRPANVLIMGDRLYVADVRLNLIRVLDKQTGELLKTIGEEARLGWPVDLSKTLDGNILVTETGAQRLRILSPDGEVLSQIGTPGDRVGNFGRPKATDVDRDGNIYAVDVAFQNVQVFDSEGTALMYFGKTNDMNSLVMPAGIALTYDNMLAFQPYAAPGFELEYVIAVSSQGAPPSTGTKVSIYGFGKMQGTDYSLSAPEE